MTVTDEMVAKALAAYWGPPGGRDWHPKERAVMRAALTAALSDQVVVPKADDAHEWHMKPTTISDAMFKRPTFVADALRKMVANCVSLHPAGSSLYTDGERKTMLAAAEHIEAFVATASLAGEPKSG
jgi:hypothetical protein